ncbi:MAG: DUF2012 domain-containing protein [Verrucomicrobiota bacterium]|nr:DUF2012 domain-containing protein [Verrucomicrobiota bacterium]
MTLKNGKAVYQDKTDTRGSFTTGNLEAGAYNLELRSQKSMNLRGQQLAISLSTGKEAPRQSSANGAHLHAGVAMSVEVPKPSRLTG